MAKIFFIFISFFLFSTTVFAQHNADTARWFIQMQRELHLTKDQERQIKKIDYATQLNMLGVYQLKISNKAKQKKYAQLNSDRKKNINKVLNKEQRERWQMILENKPRRGVTNLPNERTINR
jgi:Spy/CpxP family protein refolding chaperone